MKTLFLLPSMLLLALGATGQVSTNYTFTKETGQLLDIEDYPGIVITNHTVNDDQVLPAKIPIPFPFEFNGVTYDSVGINENGFIWFGDAGADEMADILYPISETHSAKGIVSAIGTDLHPHVTSSLPTTIKSGVGGISPMEELVIQWTNTTKQSALNDPDGEDTIYFQIKLYRFMNRIEIAYGEFRLNPNDFEALEVGLRGETIADFNNRMTDATHDWTNTIPGTAINSNCALYKDHQPQYGDLFVWMPNATNPTGIKKIQAANHTVYPNPSTGDVYFATENISDADVIVSNTLGQQVTQTTITGNTTYLNTERLAGGVYVYTIVSATGEVLGNGRFAISR